MSEIYSNLTIKLPVNYCYFLTYFTPFSVISIAEFNA